MQAEDANCVCERAMRPHSSRPPSVLRGRGAGHVSQRPAGGSFVFEVVITSRSRSGQSTPAVQIGEEASLGSLGCFGLASSEAPLGLSLFGSAFTMIPR